ncbi:MAG TPA: hypothetical protein PK079_15265 [Leptospiraceae bacterium]|nr:hypothetical protein [Leptospiraceae bacterium]HMW07220.1 hypothetical protein [Leptospiraceae bacterium]HMX33077.1 hypothetical protein [Leptospiraceae bacterium]HMY32630.1 hypothetical protein [Leptospiraceae bacterium]HMZ63743.1 hypothetical protein [Leptospiraceae bacterium]
MYKKNLLGGMILCITSILPSSVYALGTYAEGSVVAKIIQFESRGILFESFEGVMEVTKFDKEEKCDSAKDECFAPQKTKTNFSVRMDKPELINFISKNLNQDLLLGYNIHRITPISLSSDMEILTAAKQESSPAPEQGEKLAVQKSGGKRNFSVTGKVLQLDYQGTIIGTYEGLYLDETRGKVHPFSVTNEQMAKYALAAMKSGGKYYLGISVAYATGFRKSDYDLFEINYKEPAGGVNVKVN